ncbi:MAG: hypothetical protein Q4G59_00570 [Planctomycetia bacterium]|nr:hypothetical protein [Planctomycetia bacterium]
MNWKNIFPLLSLYFLLIASFLLLYCVSIELVKGRAMCIAILIAVMGLFAVIWMIAADCCSTEPEEPDSLSRTEWYLPRLTWDMKFFDEYSGKQITPLPILKCEAERHYLARALLDTEWAAIHTQTKPFALELWYIKLSDIDMAELAKCSCLQSLFLHSCYVTQQGYSSLVQMQQIDSLYLGGLQIDGIDIGDEHLPSLKSLSSLHSLELGYSERITDLGLDALAELPQLKLLSLSDIKLKGDGFTRLTQIKSIAIGWYSSNTDRLLTHLVPLTQLENVHIGCSDFSDAGLATLAQLPRLQKLVIQIGFSSITDKGVTALKSATSLRMLILSSCPKVTDRGIASLSELVNLESLKLGCEKLTDASMKSISQLVRLEYLDISSCEKVSAAGLALLSGLTCISKLSLPYKSKPEAYLPAIKTFTQLDELDCGHSTVTDDLLSNIAGMVHLRKLKLSTCPNLTDQGMSVLSSLQKLEMLDLFGNAWLTDDGLRHIASLKKLRWLDLSGCSSLPDDCISTLTQLPDLQWLGLGQTQITGSALSNLASSPAVKKLQMFILDYCDKLVDDDLCYLESLPELETLSLNHCNGLSGKCFSHLIKFPVLKTLSLQESAWLTDDDLSIIPEFSHLEELSLGLCHGLTNRALDILNDCKQLKHLSVWYCKHLSENKVQQLEKLLPDCYISFRFRGFL